jgi:pyruvate/2-oxoglutarate dehydrogenase complex dihydrolipoamide acyltransferase (E2) component
MFYEAHSPDSPQFVREGDRVSEGQTLGIIEAMKIFNEIVADQAGTVREVCVQNAEAVEYGTLLFNLGPGNIRDRLIVNGLAGISITSNSTLRLTLLEGFTGGDVEGVFAGQVLRSQLSYDQRIVSLEAVYEVQAGPHSLTALIRGGRTNNPGDAILNGVVLDGWRAGANVHVEFQRKPPPSPTESACEGAPAGLACFQGTITVGLAPR